ncbi:MAG: HAD family hydrolase [Pseudomonadota bacterium]
MALAIFDLDNTLLGGDSDHEWGEFLVAHELVDVVAYKQANDQFFEDYQNGCLNMDNFLSFSLQPLTQFSLERLNALHAQFMEERIQPIMLTKAADLLADHKHKGDTLLIITATNRFITEPIARLLNVDDILATEPEFDGTKYSGNVVYPPCFQEGKITHLRGWLEQHPEHSLTDSYFYSDSHNDLPLLELVDHPVAVNPDDTLRDIALNKSWPILDLRNDG